MQGWSEIGTAGLYWSCFGLSIVSALLPWVNCEVLLLSMSALARSPLDLVNIVLLTSAGQMAGKCALYWAGRGSLRLPTGRVAKTVAAWRGKFESCPSGPAALVFISSALGIPPFYVITVLAGAFRMRFGTFVALGAAGRLLRFGLLVILPYAGLHLLHHH
jgi:membrane protein YqaA with SNARE-associated domain